MIIDYSSTTGPVRCELADAPPRVTNEFGEELILFTFQNARTRGRVMLYLRPEEELDDMLAAKRKLRK